MNMSASHDKPRKRIRLYHLVILLVFLLGLTYLLSRRTFGSYSLQFNEVMSANSCMITDEDGDYSDWLELYNSGTASIDLTGYWLSDDPTNPVKWKFPEVVIEPGEYLIIFASGKDRTDPLAPYLHTNFRLSAGGETLVLSTADVRIIESIEIGPLYSNISYGRPYDSYTEWQYFFTPSPGSKNTAGYEKIEKVAADNIDVTINEVLTNNSNSLTDHDGDLSDWIEISNNGSTAQNLEGFWLSDKADDPFKWRFPDITLKAGEYLIVYASGKNRAQANTDLHTNFSLNDSTDQLIFSSTDGRTIDELILKRMIINVSYGRDSTDAAQWLYYPVPTPMRPNTTQGFTELSGKDLTLNSTLVINEVQAMNTKTLRDEDGDFSDWIEIYNNGNEEINLSEYSLTDNDENPKKWQFPNLTLKPQNYLLVFASGKNRRDSAQPLHANFKLSTAGETIQLTAPGGLCLDSLVTGRLASDLSSGRYPDGSRKRHFFSVPSPGSQNAGQTLLGSASAPVFSDPGGFYNTPITVSLSLLSSQENAVIRYTLDGKEPTDTSPVYNIPLTIEKTTVVRAKTFSPGMLPSATVNESYFINDRPTLTVVSIFIDPYDMWDPAEGIYVKGNHAEEAHPHLGANFWQPWEKPIHFQLFEPNGKLGFCADAGIRIGGQYSRAMPQKAFNIFARKEYGSDVFEYPFFPDNPLTTRKAITLRQSGQDAAMSKIRDAMMTSLLGETTLDYQDSRPAIVYINGEYWGLYNIRDRLNEFFLAYKHDIDPKKIDLLQGNRIIRTGTNNHYNALRTFVETHDMRITENYEYVKTQMDVENFMDYWIAEIYFANTDNSNIRFWHEQRADGKWRWIAYDKDWGFFNVHHNTLASVTNPEGTGVGRYLSTSLLVGLLNNPEFKDMFLMRMAYHLNHTFHTERVTQRINAMAALIEPEIPRALKRWGGTMSQWQYHIQRLRDFAAKRPAIVVGHVQRKFNLSEQDLKRYLFK